MATHVEKVDGGLVTSKDPALLGPGQLSDLRNAVYRRGSPSLHRARGMASFATASSASANVVGLRDIKFDNAEHYLAAAASSSVFFSDVGDTGDFSTKTVTLPGVPSQLEVAHYNNRHFMFFGINTSADATAANTNRVAYLSATGSDAPSALQTRVHGMLPVIEGPADVTAAGTFSLTVTGFYEYWTTEVAEIVQDGTTFDLESGFVGSPTTFHITATGQVPEIAMPTPRNSSTTKWRVYRSSKKDARDDQVFPVGFMISESALLTAGQDNKVQDTLTTASASAFPASFNTGTWGDFANASRMGADDDNHASAAVAGLGTFRRQGVYNFSGLNDAFRGAIRGIEVEMQAYSSGAPVTVGVEIGNRRSTAGIFSPKLTFPIRSAGSKRAGKSVVVTGTASPGQVVTLGSSTDRWLGQFNKEGFADSDFDGNFMAVVNFGSVGDINVDYLKMTVYHAATSPSVIQFPTVAYTFGDVSAQVSKNGPPPSAETGDTYQGSLVVNDVDNPSFVRYSFPLEPESFPDTYFIDFETRENDQVRLIKVVNNRLMVGLDTSLWRINYLPSERDASFDRGRAKEVLSSTFGVVNPMCATLFSMDEKTEQMAFVSKKGIHYTDGFNFVTLTEDLDWRALFPVGSTAIALINNPEQRELIFYFKNPDDADNEDDQALHLNYSAEHVRGGGRLKISGPVNMRRYNSVAAASADLRSAWPVTRSNGDTSIYYGYGSRDNDADATGAGAGEVFIASGTALGSIKDEMTITTRRMYLAGFGNEWKVNDWYAYLPSYSGTPSLTVTPKNVKTDDTAGEVTKGSSAVRTLGGERMVQFPLRQLGEGIRFTCEVTGNHNDMELAFFVVDGEGFGTQDSGL